MQNFYGSVISLMAKGVTQLFNYSSDVVDNMK